MIYKLVLKNEVDGVKRRSWTFKAPIVLGREPGSDLCIDHHSISRQHCQFTLNGDEALMVKDLGSLNGLYVDDNRVQQQILMPNQILQVGALQLQVQFSTEDELASMKGQPTSGNADMTRRMEVFTIDPAPEDKPWWRRILG